MRTDRLLIVVGSLCLIAASSTLLVGSSGFPLLSLGALALGAILLVVGLERSRGRSSAAVERDPARGERVVRIAFTALAVLGVLAGVVAIVVPVGEARGHAVFHLLTGAVCLGLFAMLAFPWHPVAGSGRAMLRAMVLTLLALATAGSFVESLGGAGYDAANTGRRIALLASLHDVGVWFGAFVMVGVPIGIITGVAVLVGHVAGRGRPTSEPTG